MIGVRLACVAGCVIAWRHLVAPAAQPLNTDVDLQLSYQALSWRMYLAGLVGSLHEPESSAWLAAAGHPARRRTAPVWFALASLIVEIDRGGVGPSR